MFGEGNLRTATRILLELIEDIRKKTTTAQTLARAHQFAEANQILEKEIAYAQTQKELAQQAKSQAKIKVKHAELFLTYPKLEREVTELFDAMTTLKAEYTRLDQQDTNTEAQPIEEPVSIPSKGTGRPETPHSRPADPIPKHLQEEADYLAALNNLLILKREYHHPKLDTALNKLITHIKWLKKEKKESTDELIEALSKTHQLLQNKLSKVHYKAYAHTVQGKSSHGMQVLGGLMIAVSIAAIALAVILFPTLGVATCSAIGLTGLLFGAGGISLFAVGQQKGLSKALSNVNNAKLLVEAAEPHQISAAPLT